MNDKKYGGYRSKINDFTSNNILSILLKIIYPPPPLINCIGRKQLAIIQELIFSKGGRVLNVGSGIGRGIGYKLWETDLIENCIVLNLDICSGPGIDIVADATDLPDDIGKFNSIILQAVPEHVEDIAKLFTEMYQILSHNGFLYIEMPFLQGYHADPDDYWRTTVSGMRVLNKNLELIKYGVSAGPIGSLIWIITDLASNISFFSYKFNLIIRFILRWLLCPFRYLDLFISNSIAAERNASEFYYIFKKSKVGP